MKRANALALVVLGLALFVVLLGGSSSQATAGTMSPCKAHRSGQKLWSTGNCRFTTPWTDTLSMSNRVERTGLLWAEGRRLAIDSASCIGLRRYGVRTSTYGPDKFHAFKCYADAANGYHYTVYFYPHEYSIEQLD